LTSAIRRVRTAGSECGPVASFEFWTFEIRALEIRFTAAPERRPVSTFEIGLAATIERRFAAAIELRLIAARSELAPRGTFALSFLAALLRSESGVSLFESLGSIGAESFAATERSGRARTWLEWP
jgi:hypothetical protein